MTGEQVDTAGDAGVYGVTEFVAAARRIMESPAAAEDRAAAVRALEPLLRNALDGPGWEDPRFATVTESGRLFGEGALPAMVTTVSRIERERRPPSLDIIPRVENRTTLQGETP